MGETRLTIFKEFRFHAAHQLPRVPAGHPCGRVHGHEYVVRLEVTGTADPVSGFVVDFADIAAAWKPIHAALDHQFLNEVAGLENPTCENLAVWIWERIRFPISRIVVHETATAGVVYAGKD